MKHENILDNNAQISELLRNTKTIAVLGIKTEAPYADVSAYSV